MAPIEITPHAGEIMQPPERVIPQPKPRSEEPEKAERPSNMDPEVPSPDPVPPLTNPDPQPGDPRPKAPPSDDETGRRRVPIELPGKPGVPERA